jgi:hypothetical protein
MATGEVPVVRNQTRGALWGGNFGERGRGGREAEIVDWGGVMVLGAKGESSSAGILGGLCFVPWRGM